MKVLTSLIKFLIYSNLYVALCVVSFTHFIYIILDIPKKNMWVIFLLVFCSTFFTYNVQRLVRLARKPPSPSYITERLSWVIKHRYIILLSSIVFAFIGLGMCFLLEKDSWVILCFAGALSIFYVVPVLPFLQKKSLTLRDIPFIKIFIISIVWSMVIVALPLLNSTALINSMKTYLALVYTFLFVFAITLPFDIRDIKIDEQNRLATIPQLIGVKATVVLSQVLLISSMLVLYQMDLNNHLFYTLVVAHILIACLILLVNQKRNELFFSGIVEGSVLILDLSATAGDYFFLP